MTSFSLNVGLASINFDPELNDEVSDGEALLSLKESITNEFKQLNKKVIIIIDNIDRLSDKEVSQILMLVKSLADFPRVVYILSFDKDAVVGSLKNLKIHAPEMFLEKIVQIPIVVPEIRKSQLDNLVLNHLGEFYEKYYDGNDLKKDFLDIIRMKLIAFCVRWLRNMEIFRQSMQHLSQRTRFQKRALWRTV